MMERRGLLGETVLNAIRTAICGSIFQTTKVSEMMDNSLHNGFLDVLQNNRKLASEYTTFVLACPKRSLRQSEFK